MSHCNKKLKPTKSKIKRPISQFPDLEVEKKIHLSISHKGNAVELSEDLFTATGYKGYRSVTANSPITEGSYYFEVKIETPSLIEEEFKFNSVNVNEISRIEPHVRIGIATILFDKEISLGSDSHSYAYKDIDGSIIHKGIRTPYGEKFGVGDVVGVLLHMKPPKPKFPSMDDGPDRTKPKLEINEGSQLYFFLNGKPQGEAFSDLHDGFYYATVSLYMGAKVKMNFGPDFELLPSSEDLGQLPEELKDIKAYSVIANEPRLYEDVSFP